MISLYIMNYYYLEYLRDCIDSVRATASEPLEITIVDSKSVRSDEIAQWGREQVDKGNIKRFVSASTNCKGFGLVWAYKNFPPISDIVVLTDGDIVVPEGLDWLAEIKDGLSKARVAGFPLDLSNFVPPNTGDPTEQSFGTWLMGLRREDYNSYVQKLDYHLDQEVLNHVGRNFHRSSKTLYHRGFDIPFQYPELWQQKIKGTHWWDAEGTVEYDVYEN